MVIRTFIAFDSASLVVQSSSNGGIVGNPVINNSSTPNGTVFDYTGGNAAEVSLDDTGGGSGRFNDDQPGNHVITNGNGLVANGTAVESESIIRIRALDDNGNQTGPTINVYVFSQNGNFADVWGFATSELLQDGTSYVKTGGNNAGTSRYNNYVTCFAEGTRIATADGEIPVEDIKVGQELWTLNKGNLPVRWVAGTTVTGQGAFAPVVFEAGVIGNDAPLIVSQQHRIWIKNAMAELLFGKSEVLVAAKHMVGVPGVRLDPRQTVAYTHFMFDSHQIVRANGALTESFFYGETALGTLEATQRAELDALFPILGSGFDSFGVTATMTLNGREAAALRPYLAA